MNGGTSPTRSRRRVKLVLVSALALGAIASVTVRGVWALYSTQESNYGSNIASGTLTMQNTNSLGSGLSTTLSAKVGVTTLNGSITASATSITVNANSSFPSSGTLTIIVDNEEMTVTAGLGSNTWTVTRGANGTQPVSHANSANVYQASIGVSSASGFQTTGDYTILVDNEEMTVTGGQGTTTWTVARGVDGTAVASHSSGATVATNTCLTRNANTASNLNPLCDSVFTYSPGAIAVQTTLNGGISSGATSITVTSGTGFANNQIVVIDAEAIQIVSGGGTTSWTVTRGVDGTTAASHSNGAYVSHQTLGEDYPGMPVTTPVTIANGGSLAANNLEVYMPSCLRGVTPDAPWASSTPSWSTKSTTLSGSAAKFGVSATLHSSATNSDATITLNGSTGFTTTTPFTIDVGDELMTVTAEGVSGGYPVWTVTRGVSGTTAAAHSSGAAVYAVSTITVASASGFPSTGKFPIQIDGEQMLVVAGAGTTTWTVLGAYNGTQAASHASGATVTWTGFSIPAGVATTGGHLAGANTYYYEITAVSSSGESIASSEQTYTTMPGETTNQVTLNWSSVAGATSYKVYRSTTEGGEALLASGIAATTYQDNTATSPSGSPPSGTGSGNPCLTGNGGLYIQETNSSGAPTQCWYPDTNATCTFDPSIDLGIFASYYNTLGQSLTLSGGLAALGTRYFTIGFELPSGAGNSLQGTEAIFVLRWYAQP